MQTVLVTDEKTKPSDIIPDFALPKFNMHILDPLKKRPIFSLFARCQRANRFSPKIAASLLYVSRRFADP